MEDNFNPKANYEKSMASIGYVPRKQATQKDYDRIGFMSGLEVHQQLLTKKKLFCHCPAGVFNKHHEHDAEIIRHMRPTLSELGEYDGTALMEFRTRKEIIYRIKHKTACTYEVDDTPPFPIDREALDIAIEISLLSKLNIVGEVHVTRKQYLDGSIPTGFQRTAIIGVEGEIQLKNKKVRLIQLSIEEDSCREISDIGHTRIYKTDRLGMPLIETVTYPEMVNPDEVKEACDYIRFLNRSTGKVRTGIGAGREDVNVSCRGGHRVEIKGVAHTKWIPELTHVEAFRQWALLSIKQILNERIFESDNWKIKSAEVPLLFFNFANEQLKKADERGEKIVVVNLPEFHGILSHFTQPGKCFNNEISDRLKVIACIEKPNMISSEDFEPEISSDDLRKIKTLLKAGENDAQIVFWGPADDIKTALETIEERCVMAMQGIPPETRKSFVDGTTIFERVLPGADRMYPDTDSAPIPLPDEHINFLGSNLPSDIIDRYNQMKNWGIPEDTFTYIFKRNLYPMLERIINDLKISPVFAGTFFGHTLKFIEGHYKMGKGFSYEQIFGMFKFLKDNNIKCAIAEKMLIQLFQYPRMDFESILSVIHFKRISEDEIVSKIPFLKEKFAATSRNNTKENEFLWVMGQLRQIAIGNICLTDLSKKI